MFFRDDSHKDIVNFCNVISHRQFFELVQKCDDENSLSHHVILIVNFFYFFKQMTIKIFMIEGILSFLIKITFEFFLFN